MVVSGECTYHSVKSGVSSKTGKPYSIARFHDPDAGEYFSIFLNAGAEHIFDDVAKNAPLMLTLEIVPGQKFCTFVSAEKL